MAPARFDPVQDDLADNPAEVAEYVQARQRQIECLTHVKTGRPALIANQFTRHAEMMDARITAIRRLRKCPDKVGQPGG